jgi:flagellin
VGVFSVVTNVPSLIAQSYLRRNESSLSKALERLSSGYRINSAADDAAGLALSTRLTAEARSYAVAERNTSAAIDMTATADSGASQITASLQRMREIAVQASNGTLTSTDRSQLDTEYQALLTEIDRLASVTQFNGFNLLTGTSTTINFQVGINATANDRIAVSYGGVSITTLGVSNTLVSGSVATNANSAITAIDSGLASIGTTRARFGAAINRLQFALDNDINIRTNLEAAASTIRDADIAQETSALARYQVLVQAGTSVLASANQLTSLAAALLG